MSRTAERIVVVDGYCHLCSGWARFMTRHPTEPRFRILSMQSEAGRRLLALHGIDPEDPATFLVIDEGGAFYESEAVIRLVMAQGGLWRCAGVLRVLPRPLRDAAYRLLARNRYRWFGRRAVCELPGA